VLHQHALFHGPMLFCRHSIIYSLATWFIELRASNCIYQKHPSDLPRFRLVFVVLFAWDWHYQTYPRDISSCELRTASTRHTQAIYRGFDSSTSQLLLGFVELFASDWHYQTYPRDISSCELRTASTRHTQAIYRGFDSSTSYCLDLSSCLLRTGNTRPTHAIYRVVSFQLHLRVSAVWNCQQATANLQWAFLFHPWVRQDFFPSTQNNAGTMWRCSLATLSFLRTTTIPTSGQLTISKR